MNLDDLSYLQAEATLKALAGGKIGFDTRRDPRTNRKASLLEYIASNYGEAEVAAVIASSPWSPSDSVETTLSEDAPAPKAPTPKATAKTPAKPVPVDGGDKLAKIAAMLAELATSSVDEEAVRAIVNDAVEPISDAQHRFAADVAQKITELGNAVAKVAERPIYAVTVKEAPVVMVEDHVHPVFAKVLKLAAAGVNVMLKGPAGCGKTHLCEQVAKAMSKPFGAISGSAGASESQLVGRLLPTGEGGRFEYHQSPFVTLYESGGVFLFDEMDAFDPNMLLVVNTATANGHFTVEARSDNPAVCRHADSVLLAATNTFGTGPDAVYVGRSQLDAATLDRWYIVEMDYDREFERQCAPREVVDWVWSLRNKVTEAKLRRVVSTRMIQKMGKAMAAGFTFREVREDMLIGWSRDERSKVGV